MQVNWTELHSFVEGHLKSYVYGGRQVHALQQSKTLPLGEMRCYLKKNANIKTQMCWNRCKWRSIFTNLTTHDQHLENIANIHRKELKTQQKLFPGDTIKWCTQLIVIGTVTGIVRKRFYGLILTMWSHDSFIYFADLL